MVKKALRLAKSDPSVELANDNHEHFCQLFTDEGEFFGDGREAYIIAYDVDLSKPNAYKTASSAASQLLRNLMVLQRIDYLLENKLGFNDQHIDKQLAFLITQSSDLRVKLQAIREYNALHGRVKKKLEITMDDKTDSELDAELEALEREIAQTDELVASQSGDNVGQGMPVLTESQKAQEQARSVHGA